MGGVVYLSRTTFPVVAVVKYRFGLNIQVMQEKVFHHTKEDDGRKRPTKGDPRKHISQFWALAQVCPSYERLPLDLMFVFNLLAFPLIPLGSDTPRAAPHA